MELLYYQLQLEYGKLEQEVRLYRMFYGALDRSNPAFLRNLGQQSSVPAPPAPFQYSTAPSYHDNQGYYPRGRGNRGGPARKGGGDRPPKPNPVNTDAVSELDALRQANASLRSEMNDLSSQFQVHAASGRNVNADNSNRNNNSRPKRNVSDLADGGGKR